MSDQLPCCSFSIPGYYSQLNFCVSRACNKENYFQQKCTIQHSPSITHNNVNCIPFSANAQKLIILVQCMVLSGQSHSHQALKMLFIGLPVLFVVRVGLDWRLQNHDNVIETRVGQQCMETFFTNDTFTQTCMYVPMTTKRHLCIIHMQYFEFCQPDGFVEMAKLKVLHVNDTKVALGSHRDI